MKPTRGKSLVQYEVEFDLAAVGLGLHVSPNLIPAMAEQLVGKPVTAGVSGLVVGFVEKAWVARGRIRALIRVAGAAVITGPLPRPLRRDGKKRRTGR